MTTHPLPTPSPGATSPSAPTRWFAALAFLVLLTEQSALSYALIAPALIGLATEYETTQVIWVFTIFALFGSVLTPILGKLGDRHGKRKVLTYAAIISAIGCVIAATAPTFGILLVGRALMGASIAFLPVTFALIRDVFPENYRNVSIGLVTNGAGAVMVAGPFIAGYLIDNFGSGSVFWFVLAITSIGAAGTIALVPESPVRTRSSIDYVGAAGLASAVLLLMYGISQLQTWSVTDYRTVLTIGGSLVILVAWWIWESKVDEPFVDTTLLCSRPIATVMAAYSLSAASISVLASYFATLLQTPRALGIDYGFGLTASELAFYMLPGGTLTVLAGIAVGLLAKRHGFRPFIIIGPLLLAAGSLGIGLLTTEPWMPIVFLAVAGLGSVVLAAGPGSLMMLAPSSSRGVMAGMMMAIGGAIGSAASQVAGLILSKNIGQVVQGYAVPTGTGMALVYVLSAGVAIAGLLAALCIPRSVPAEVAPVSDKPADPALATAD